MASEKKSGKIFLPAGLVSLLLLFVFACASRREIRSQEETTIRDTLFQISTFSALFAGNYEGRKTFAELKKLGDFGLGTMQDLDGEMIALDGEYYRIDINGRTAPVADSAKTPHASVTFFDPGESFFLEKGPFGFARLESALDAKIKNKNLLHAIRIDGLFKSVRARSIPAQVNPSASLETLLRTEPNIHEFKEIEGTLIGFYYPASTGSIGIPGYHFHFISLDRTRGGHVLDCTLRHGRIQLDITPKLHIEFNEKI